jgi:putative ABC transport system permease protein
MFFTQLIEFLRDLRAQKLRTAMTVFGIIWGTVAIVVLLAFGMGFKKQLSKDMHGIGESLVIMFPNVTTKPFAGFGIGRPVFLTEDDAKLIASQVKSVDKVVPEYGTSDYQVRVGVNITNTNIGGVYPVYSEMRNIWPQTGGRFIDEQDMQERRRVIFIGDGVKDLLFGDSDPLGKTVIIGRTPFTVIGVMIKKTQNSSYNRRDKDRVFIPATTFSAVFGVIHVHNLIFTPKDPRDSKQVMSQVREVLAKKYKFDPTDEDAVGMWDTTEMDKFMFYFFLAFNIFMGLIGSFTLAVGGIGVANIMYIVVQERVREIGVKRAVGAKRNTILFQFFFEAMFIVAFGSSIGFVIAIGITQLMAYMPIQEFVGTPVISIQVAIATALVLAIVGVTSGLLPARRAANLDVVEALRA